MFVPPLKSPQTLWHATKNLTSNIKFDWSILFLLFFRHSISIKSPDWPGAVPVDQADSKLSHSFCPCLIAGNTGTGIINNYCPPTLSMSSTLNWVLVIIFPKFFRFTDGSFLLLWENTLTKSNSKEGFISDPSCRLQSIIVGWSQWQSLGAGHMHSQEQREKEMDTSSLPNYLFLLLYNMDPKPRMVLPIFRLSHPITMKIIKTTLIYIVLH